MSGPLRQGALKEPPGGVAARLATPQVNPAMARVPRGMCAIQRTTLTTVGIGRRSSIGLG
jgi:hypothetical protein